MNDRSRSRLSVSELAGLVVIITSAAVLAGWWLHRPGLTTVLPGFVAMKANSAAGFMLAGLSLALLGCSPSSSQRQWQARVAAAVVALLGLLTLCQYLFGLNFGIDQLLLQERSGAVGTLAPGRMAPLSALNFLLLGGALLLVSHRRTITVAQQLALLTGLLGLLPLAGDLCGAAAVVGIGRYMQIAIHSGLLFILMSVGVLVLHPEDGLMGTVTADTPGGMVLRRLAPCMIGLPFFLGWLRMFGESHGLFQNALGEALMAAGTMVVLMGLSWWTARILNLNDRDRRQVEATLRENEARFRAIFDYSTVGKLLISPDGILLRVNQAMARMLGLTMAGLQRISIPEIIHPDDVADFRKCVRQLLAREQDSYRAERRFRHQDGHDVYCDVSTTLLRDSLDRPLYFITTIVDISERKREEEALRTSQEIIEGIMNAIPVRVFWKDKNLEYLGCNTLLAHDAGLTDAHDIIGKNDFQMTWHDQAEKYRSDDRQVIGSGQAKLLIEEPQTTPTGETLTLLTSKVPLRDANGEVAGILGTYMDITERKQVEAALAASELRYRRLFESARDGILILNAETGCVVDVNPYLLNMLQFTRDELLGKKLWEIGRLAGIVPHEAAFVQLTRDRYTHRENISLSNRDGQKIEVEFIGNLYAVDGSNVIQCDLRDITARVALETRRELAVQVLGTLNCSQGNTHLVRDVVHLIRESMELEAAGIRLRDGYDFPYFEVDGFPESFVKAERFLCERDCDGQILRDAAGQPLLACMCGQVICGQTDPQLPCFTPGGSFWTNSTTAALASLPQTGWPVHSRHRCNLEGYESMALIPLRSGDTIIGLMQLGDHRPGKFTLELIRFLEEIGASIGIALARHQAVDAMLNAEALNRMVTRLMDELDRSLDGVDGHLVLGTDSADASTVQNAGAL